MPVKTSVRHVLALCMLYAGTTPATDGEAPSAEMLEFLGALSAPRGERPTPADARPDFDELLELWDRALADTPQTGDGDD